MKKFKDLISDKAFNRPLEFPSVSVTYGEHVLELRFDSKDILINAGFTGPFNLWLSSLCSLMKEKSLSEISQFSWETWKEAYKDDQIFWEVIPDEETKFLSLPLEMCKAALDIYRGREYLYQEESPLVCRCFGIRESDILAHLKANESPTLETLAGESKAGMGCRSCVPQLKRWMVMHEAKKQNRFYKERPIVDWLLQIDESLAKFPLAKEWNMEVKSLKGFQVSISFEKDVSQIEEEKVGKELQDFLGRVVDPDLGFFLRSARHFSKAKG